MRKGLLVLVVLITGCSTARYTAPSAPQKPSFTTVINEGYDQTWEAVIDHVSSTFFAIENFEKESGLITVTFGSDDPDEFINCGNHFVKITRNYRTQTFDGPYETFVVGMNGSFSGRMNISAREISKEKTEVRVNAKYILQDAYGHTWNFNSGSFGEAIMQNTYADSHVRKCYPTYKAENSILNTIKKIAE